jgi:hypothetical protein
MSDGAPYSRDELVRIADEAPVRGPVCPKCGMHIPQFADLNPNDEARVRYLIRASRKVMAIQELSAATGCSLSWAKLWVHHGGRPDVVGTTAPCPYCGKPLKSARAKQCPHCSMDWHDPVHPRSLKRA